MDEYARLCFYRSIKQSNSLKSTFYQTWVTKEHTSETEPSVIEINSIGARLEAALFIACQAPTWLASLDKADEPLGTTAALETAIRWYHFEIVS